MSRHSDVLVVGGGPAGAAAGIAALRAGLAVTLLEASATQREKPGETLHPGASAILKELGCLDDVEAAAQCRPEGHWIMWGGSKSFHKYAAAGGGEWRAIQIRRVVLERLLLEEFRARGGRIVRPTPPSEPIVIGERVVGLSLGGKHLLAPVTIDATGTRGLLRRALRIREQRLSPPLLAYYGHRQGFFGPHPFFEGTSCGWTWIAQVEEDRVAWVSLRRAGAISGIEVPLAVVGLTEDSAPGATDVTWRMAERLAGPGWILVGEAAAVIDPAASHGVLRALMSGMMAARSAAAMVQDPSSAARAGRAYAAWMQTWFQQDVASLLALYASVGFEWKSLGGAERASKI